MSNGGRRREAENRGDDQAHRPGADGFATPEQRRAAEELANAMARLRPRLRGSRGAGVGALLFGATARRWLRVPRLRGRRLKVFGFGLLIAVMSVTTCSFGVDPADLVASYGDPIPATIEDAVSFMEKGSVALRRMTEGGSLALRVTEAEATSALSLGMLVTELVSTVERIPPEELRTARDLQALRERIWLEQDAARDEMLARLSLPERMLARLDPRIRTGDVQVRFEGSGEIVVAGFVQAWRFRQAAMFVVAPRAGGGELELDFVRGRLGRLPAPEFAFDLLGDLLESLVLMGQEYAAITDLAVGDGSLELAGRVRN